MNERFIIALSYSGEKRDFVSKVADELSKHLGRKNVFYDKYYEAILNYPRVAFTIQDIYEKRSDLLVVFISKQYSTSDWCGIEWQVIKGLIAMRRSEDIMLIRFDDTIIEGIHPKLDGYLKVGNKKPKAIAEAILERAAYKGIITHTEKEIDNTQEEAKKATQQSISKKMRLIGLSLLPLFIVALIWHKWPKKHNEKLPGNQPERHCISDHEQIANMIDSIKYNLLKIVDSRLHKIADTISNSAFQWLQQQQDSLLEVIVKKNTTGEPCYTYYKSILHDSLSKGKIISRINDYLMEKEILLNGINQALRTRSHSISDNLLTKYNITDNCRIVLVNNDSAEYILNNFLHRQAIKVSYIPIQHITELNYESGVVSLIYCVLEN
jgi:hypothetical protein